MLDILMPLMSTLAMFVILGVFFYLRYLNRKDAQQTLRATIEHGIELTPGFLSVTGDSNWSPNRDLRRGTITGDYGIVENWTEPVAATAIISPVRRRVP